MVDQWNKRIDTLKDKDSIDPSQSSTLKTMAGSSDKENLILAKEIVRLKINETLLEGLNEDQKQAFVSIMVYFNDPVEDAFVLKGYAGTGKTFLIKRIVESIVAGYPNRRIAITAPTNKAVQVLQMNAPFLKENKNASVFSNLFDSKSQLEYTTIHKLMGLKEVISANGEQSFKSSSYDKGKGPGIKDFKYLIIDESSMLDDFLFREVIKHKDNLRIIFMGDPAQIPPVNRQDSIPFKKQEEFDFKVAVLKEIMRQKEGNPIVSNSFTIRDNITVEQPLATLSTQLDSFGNGVHHFDSATDRAMIRPLLKDLFKTDAFKEDANHAKVIAWTNKTVRYVNSVIREILYGENPKTFVNGEKLVANKPLFEKVNGPRGLSIYSIKFNTSDEFVIQDVKVLDKVFSEKGGYSLKAKVYQCKVRAYDYIDQSYYSDYIKIIHEDSKEDWNALAQQAKEMALSSRKSSDWVIYYNILKWSANVSYNYAITAHKSQGSTYKNVLLMEEDIDKNYKVIERNRIKYTAYTRPTDNLYILRQNY